MNAIIDLFQKHRSIRKFTNEPVSAEQREAILTCGSGGLHIE